MELPAPPRSPAVGLHAGCLRVLFYRRLTDKWALGARRAAKEPLHWRRWRVKSAIRGPVCLSVCQAACLSVCQRVTDLRARSLAFAALLFSPPTSLVSLTGANVSVPLKSVHSSEFDGRVYLFFFPSAKQKPFRVKKERLKKREMDVFGCTGKSTARLLPKLLVSARGTRAASVSSQRRGSKGSSSDISETGEHEEMVFLSEPVSRPRVFISAIHLRFLLFSFRNVALLIVLRVLFSFK